MGKGYNVLIRRSPCELYIKYLLCHPDGYVLEAVKDIVVGQALDYPSDVYAQGLRRRLRVPIPFYPLNTAHARSQRFLRAERLVAFFHPDEEAEEAHRLLHTPRAKETIETMTLAGDPPAHIAHRVRRLGVACTAAGVKRYCKYYWDLSLVDSVETDALLRMRLERTMDTPMGVDPTLDQTMQHFALNKAKYRDPRRMAAEMPNSPMSSLMNQLRMGLMPTQVELGRLLAATRLAAICRASEVAHGMSPTDAARGRDFMLMAKLATELMADIGSPDTELQRDLQQLILETEAESVPHVKELTQGKVQVIEAEVEEEHVVDSK